MKVHGQDGDVYVGEADADVPDWRADEGLAAEEDPDDELLEPTPSDVVAVLGYDPAGE